MNQPSQAYNKLLSLLCDTSRTITDTPTVIYVVSLQASGIRCLDNEGLLTRHPEKYSESDKFNASQEKLTVGKKNFPLRPYRKLCLQNPLPTSKGPGPRLTPLDILIVLLSTFWYVSHSHLCNITRDSAQYQNRLTQAGPGPGKFYRSWLRPDAF